VNPELSVVMPVYNESGVIEDVVAELLRDVCDRFERAEIVLVDDASTDDTPRILDRLAAEDGRVKVHHAAANGGHGPALRGALDASRGDWIFQIDSDGQQVPAEFWRLWDLRADHDLVIGIRQIRRNGRHRVVVSAAARYLNRAIGGGDIRDVNVPFKLFRRALWEDLQVDVPARPVAPSLLVAVGAGVRGWRIGQVPITHLARRHGESSVDLRNLARLSSRAFAELIRFRRGLRRRAGTAAARREGAVRHPA
jgi:dolichol-phosphate mannosyltransferase